MKKWFSLGEISKYHIISLCIPFLYMATTYVERDIIIENEGKDDNVPYDKDYQLPYFIIIFFSKIFSGFLYIINKYIINKNLLSSKLFLRNSRIYHLNINSKKKIKILIYIIIISALEVIYNFEYIRTLRKRSLIEMKIGFTFFVPIFTYFILKTKYYRHHFVSLIIGFVGFIFIILSLIFSNNEYISFNIGQQLKLLIYSIPFSLSLVLMSYLFRHYFINPFVFLFFDGIFCLFFSFIFILLEDINKIDLFLTNLRNFAFLVKKWEIFALFLLILLFSFLYYASTIITIYLFSPTLFVMNDILFPIIRWIIDSIVFIIKGKEINKIQSIFECIGYIFLYIACVIFNEIVICNFCNLNYNTYQQIKKRGIEDTKDNNDINESNILSNTESIISTSKFS